MKQSNVTKFALILACMLLCTSCERNDVANIIINIFNDGIEQVNKAGSVEDVQKIYDNVTAKVEKCKSKHLKEIASTDTVIPQINEAQHLFAKACCVRAFSFNHGYIKNEKGVTIAMNSVGEVVPLEEVEGDDGLSSEDFEDSKYMQNPLGIMKIVPKYEYYRSDILKKNWWQFRGLTLYNSNGIIKYSDEDSEQYYEQYLPLFFIALKLCDTVGNPDIESEGLRNYLEQNLTEILQDLPLKDDFPIAIQNYVNKKFFEHKEEIGSISISNRKSGVTVCSYYNKKYGTVPSRFLIYRDEEHNGALVICLNYN